MSTDSLIDLWRHAITTVAAVAAPFLVTALAVGLAVAVIQTATQLQESVLTFVPKLVATIVVLALGGHWMLDKLGSYMSQSITSSAAPQAPGGDSNPDSEP